MNKINKYDRVFSLDENIRFTLDKKIKKKSDFQIFENPIFFFKFKL